MMKRWIRIIMTLLVLMILIGSTFHAGVQANQLRDTNKNNPILVQEDLHQPGLPPGFQIVSITATGLILNLTAPAYNFETATNQGYSCQILKAEGYYQSFSSGAPVLVAAGVMLGIPPDSIPTLTVQSIASEILPGSIHLCPVATPLIQRNITGPAQDLGEVFIEDQDSYAKDRYFPARPVELAISGMIRSQRIARLSFSPFLYNPARDELQVVRQIKVELQLGSEFTNHSPGWIDEGPFESILKATLINYDQARSWRIAHQTGLVAPKIPQSSKTNDQIQYKLLINQDGIYQVTYAALQSAGVPVDSLDPRTLKILYQGVEIPIEVIGEQDGIFDPGDYLLFYGQKITSKYSDGNIYWLSWGSVNGLRMSTQDGSVHGGDTPISFKTTLQLEENIDYISGYPSGPQNDHWYWFILSAYNGPASQDFTFTIQNLDTGTPTATIRGLIKGYDANPEHHTLVYLNGNLIDDHIWPAGGEYAFSIDTTYLVNGNNTLTIACPLDGGITYDYELINWFEIDYRHTFTAENDLLDIGMADAWQFQIGGFISNTIDVFDVTDPLATVRITGGSIIPDGPFYQINFEQDLSGEHRYLVSSPSRWLSPLAITPDELSSLKATTNEADYILISHADFLDALQPLAAYRASQGLRVKVVDVQDVYDEFNGGMLDPQAIQDFLGYAYASWIPPAPSYVLLVGDGHFDFRNNYGDSGPIYIPPFLGEYDPWIGETASDNRYVTLSGGDILPDMFIGRLPANSAAETAAMVAKILSYEQNPILDEGYKHLTFVADNADQGGNFPAQSNHIADNYLPEEYITEKIYNGLPPYENPADAQGAIITAINQGQLIVHYNGHASTGFWASETLFSIDSLDSLTNDSIFPFFIPMTCMEGYFIWPDYPSLAESLVRASDKGAIASWSPSGFGLGGGHDLLAQGIYTAFFNLGMTRLGTASTYGKYYLDANGPGYRDLIDTYNLLGDPATRLNVSPPYIISLPLVRR